MYRLAAKRMLRGRGLFIALFLSVALAATLFSGIIQGSDAVAVSMTSSAFKKAKYDVLMVSGEGVKNATKTRVWEADPIFEAVSGVSHADHFVTMTQVTLVDRVGNRSLSSYLVAVPDGSELYQGIRGVSRLEDGFVYVDASSMNATSVPMGSAVGVKIQTYNPFGALSDIGFREYPLKMGSVVTLDDQTYSLVVNQYNRYLSAVLGGGDTVGGRPPLNLLVASQGTVKGFLDELYREGRRPVKDLICVVAVRLDRDKLINSWDAAASISRINPVVQQLNGVGAPLYFYPKTYVNDMISTAFSSSNAMKVSTLLVTLPVFFTAWYLGATVSDVSMGLRRREIGLLFTRGMTHRQVLATLVVEALLVGVSAGAVGVVAGSLLIPFIIPGLGFDQLLRSVTPMNLAAALAFSLALALLAVYRPAGQATRLEVVEALREYRAEEEDLGTWHEPVLAAFFGGYKLAMLLLRVDIEAFRPTSGDFLGFLLFNTWWGTDRVLGLVWMILLFWGVTRLFLLYAPWFPRLLGVVAGRLVGDVSHFTALSSRRNLKRTMAYTFMATLIIAYSFQVVGNTASTEDYTTRYMLAQSGSDMAVVLFSRQGASEFADRVSKMDGVASAAAEVEFEGMTSLDMVPVRAIDIEKWNSTAYLDRFNIDRGALKRMRTELDQLVAQYEKDPFRVMDVYPVILARAVAKPLGMRPDGTGTMTIRVQARTYTLRVVGLYGNDLGENYAIQQPTIYIPTKFLDRVKDSDVLGVRVLVRLKAGADASAVSDNLRKMEVNVQRVDVASTLVANALNNPTIAGPRHIEELAAFFASLVAALGVFLVVSTQLQTRWKELGLMAVRGFSQRQLAVSLIVENLGMALVAVILGLGIGYLNLLGQSEVLNTLYAVGAEWRIVFPAQSILSMAAVILLMVAATVIPILVAVKRISENPIVESENQ